MQVLNDFISSIRVSNTIEQEKFVITTELAKIRASIKGCEPSQRPLIVAKLMFLDLLGYSVQWGNTEIINLMSDESFSYKRIGYIAAAQILDEEDDMNVLVTQTLIKDLQNKNPYIQALALGFISNMGSAEVCPNVATDVQRLMSHSHAFVLKKAGMAAVHIVRKNPELCESFKNSVQSLLNNSSHGIVMSGLSLVIEMLTLQPKLSNAWRQFAVPLTKILKNLINGRIRPEYTTEHFYDPFLQMKTLRALKLLRRKTDDTENVLQAMINKSDLTSNIGRSIMFELAETTAAISKSQSIRGLTLNAIGRLLAINDPNALYGALCAFDRVLSRPLKGSTDAMALQRYKSSITKCLGNDDPSIRRSALSVISALIDEKNAEALIPEILEYVKMSNSDFRTDIVNRVYVAALKFKTSDKWFIQTVISLLKDSGEYVGAELLSSFCSFIKTTNEKDFALSALSSCLVDAISSQTLIQAASYVVGEYGESNSLINDLSILLTLPSTRVETQLYLITGACKLASRIGASSEVIPLLKHLQTSNEIELQQRAGELLRMFEKGIAQNILIHSENDKEEGISSILPQKDDDEDLLDLILDSPSSQPIKASNPDDILQLIATPSPEINTEYIYKCDDFRVKYERKTNEQDKRQHALQFLFIFDKGVNQFQCTFQCTPGWMMKRSLPDTPKNFPANTSNQELVYVMDAEQKPFGMRIHLSFIAGGQQKREIILNNL